MAWAHFCERRLSLKSRNTVRTRSAGITYQGYSWGMVGEVGDDWVDIGWNPGDLIGVIQSGQQLIIHKFGNDSKEETSMVFTLCSSCS